MWLVLVCYMGIFFLIITMHKSFDRDATSLTPVWFLIATTVFCGFFSYRWLHYGVDFRERRHQIEVAILCSPTIIGALSALVPGATDNSLLVPMFLASAYGAVMPICIFGPSWLGVLVALSFGGIAQLLAHSRPNVVVLSLFVLIMWVSLKSTLWYMSIFAELHHARSVEAQLVRAQERLRFASDLHDVVGRTMSTISLKTQLADQLVARGDPHAREQLAEISQLTSSSMEEMRALVRGYRAPELSDELDGAIALLRASGITVSVSGAPERVPETHRSLAAHVLREATTNILRHSNATHVSISLADQGIAVTNDRPKPAGDDTGTGIATLRERVGAAGSLRILHAAKSFTIQVDFEEAS